MRVISRGPRFHTVSVLTFVRLLLQTRWPVFVVSYCMQISIVFFIRVAVLQQDAALLATLAGRIYDDAPQQNAGPLGR